MSTIGKESISRTIRQGAWWPQILLVLASVLFATLLCEVGLRITGHFPPYPYPPRNIRPGLVEEYQPYGYRLIPSRRTVYNYPRNHPRTLSLVSNRDGFRAGRELEDRDPRPRILFLGDSFLFGDGVEESERFTNLLEAMEPSRRMDNLGMVGYGPDLMLRALEQVGLKLKPSVVVFCMYTDDFRRVLPEYAGTGFPIPRYELESGRLVSVPYPRPNFWNQLRISVAIRNIRWTRTHWQWDLNQAILDRFEELSRQQPFEAAIIFLPGTADTPDDRKRRFWLREYAARHATPFLDLSDVIHARGYKLFIEGDPHLNPDGHKLVAQELDRFLKDRTLAFK